MAFGAKNVFRRYDASLFCNINKEPFSLRYSEEKLSTCLSRGPNTDLVL